jgi:hypothetical protein
MTQGLEQAPYTIVTSSKTLSSLKMNVQNWMKNVSLNRKDTCQKLVKSSFLPSRTLGPPAS